MNEFRVPKSLEGRYCSILLEGISTVEIRIKSIDDTEIVGEHAGGEEIHINQNKLIAYWPDEARTLKAQKAKERAANRRASREKETLPDSS